MSAAPATKLAEAEKHMIEPLRLPAPTLAQGAGSLKSQHRCSIKSAERFANHVPKSSEIEGKMEEAFGRPGSHLTT